ncbi:MAG: hypothetical protein IKY61_04110, partial [Thermoguttaceae bacterium]|nr:hypothetical protein [Thermoguttaceae bacterium]
MVSKRRESRRRSPLETAYFPHFNAVIEKEIDMSNLHALDYAVLALFFLATLYIGWRSMRKA